MFNDNYSPLDKYSLCVCVCVCASSGHLANAATELMKLDHEEPQLTEPYLSKQKKLMVNISLHVFCVTENHSYIFVMYCVFCWVKGKSNCGCSFTWSAVM